MADEDMQHEEPHDEDRNDRAAAAAAAAGAAPPADRSYGDRASDHADPADGPDPRRPDSGPVRQGYDATAESAAAAADPRTPAFRRRRTTPVTTKPRAPGSAATGSGVGDRSAGYPVPASHPAAEAARHCWARRSREPVARSFPD